MRHEIKAIAWDLEGVFYHASVEMLLEIKHLYCKNIETKYDVGSDEAVEIFDKQYEISGSKKRTVIALGILTAEEASHLIDSAELENKYIFRDQDLIMLLKKLSNYRHFIITNQSRRSTDLVLKNTGVSEDIFEKIITSDDVVLPKPDTEGFENLISYCGLPAEQLLYVGDRVKVDIVPANSCGMKTCLVGGNSEVADQHVENVYELSKYY